MYVSSFLTAKYEMKSCLNWMISLQVSPRSQLISPSKTWFLEIYLKFQWQKSLKNQYLPHSESKSYQINSINPPHQDLSKDTKGTSQFLWNLQLQFNLFSVKKSFNIQELLHCKSKHHETKLMHPSSSRDFWRDQECDSKHPDSVDLISTNKKQTKKKLPSFVDRFYH